MRILLETILPMLFLAASVVSIVLYSHRWARILLAAVTSLSWIFGSFSLLLGFFWLAVNGVAAVMIVAFSQKRATKITVALAPLAYWLFDLVYTVQFTDYWLFYYFLYIISAVAVAALILIADVRKRAIRIALLAVVGVCTLFLSARTLLTLSDLFRYMPFGYFFRIFYFNVVEPLLPLWQAVVFALWLAKGQAPVTKALTPERELRMLTAQFKRGDIPPEDYVEKRAEILKKL